MLKPLYAAIISHDLDAGHSGGPAALTHLISRGFHGFFLLAGLASGALFRPPLLLVIALLMLALAEGVYTWAPRRCRAARQQAEATTPQPPTTGAKAQPPKG